MKKLHRILALTTFSLAGSLLAQTAGADAPRGPHRGGKGGPGGPGGPRGGHGMPVVRVIDADRDGALSAAELGGAPAALLTLDTNRDGAISAEELHAHPARPADAPQRPAGAPERSQRGPQAAEGTERPRPIFPVMLALDANSDGALSSGEIANATTSLNALDANKDGQLTRDELHPLPPVE